MNLNFNDVEVLIGIGTSLFGVFNWYLSHKLSIFQKRLELLEKNNENFISLLSEVKELKGEIRAYFKIFTDKK